jgi:hypothetical protein
MIDDDDCDDDNDDDDDDNDDFDGDLRVNAIEIGLRTRRRRRRRLRARGPSRIRRRVRCDVLLLIVSAAVVRRSRIARRTAQCATDDAWTDGMAGRQRIGGPRVAKTGGGHTCWYRAATDENTAVNG